MNKDFDSYLQKRLQHEGPLPLSQFMGLCLYHPEYGYYRNHNPLGQNGDFVTSPEISQMFGELIALCFMDVWQRMGAPTRIHAIELGPGRGTLMQDFLRTISPEFLKAIDLHLVDISPILKQEQRQRITHKQTTWHDDIETAFAACAQAPLFVIANEFFDALPIRQFVKKEQDWVERGITYKDGAYQMVELLTQDTRLPQLPSGATVNDIAEICEDARYITQLLTQQIALQGGMALFIDYGYTQSAYGDTLQAMRSHQYHDFLVDPGTADLTAHVDFKALKTIAEEQGAHVSGPTTQGHFLTELGIDIRAAQLKRNADSATQIMIDKTLHRLTHPEAMGELFKVLGISAPQTPSPCGFRTCIQQAA